jgi:histone H3/H4
MTDPNSDKEILVVASKIKKYVRSVAGMSTSANVLPKWSDAIRSLCDQAIENAKTDGRKTVMDRDFT